MLACLVLRMHVRESVWFRAEGLTHHLLTEILASSVP